MHDQLAVLAGVVEVGEELQRQVGKGHGRLPQELPIPRVVAVVEHQEGQLEAAHPLPLVVAALLQRVVPFREGCPAVGLGEDVAPEVDALGEEDAVEVEVAAGAITPKFQHVLGIHAEQGLEHLVVAGGAHVVVGQPGVLPPVARSPATVVGIALLAGIGNGEERAVELDGIAASAGTGLHVPLQGIGTADQLRLPRGVRAAARHLDPAAIPEGPPPFLVGRAACGSVGFPHRCD